MGFRILVTGSRDWQSVDDIRRILSAYADTHGPENVTVVHGACPRGADTMADGVALSLGCRVERWPAAWDLYGRRAGFVRNADMVAKGANVCLAFIRNYSRGATMCADLAEGAGIPVVRYREI